MRFKVSPILLLLSLGGTCFANLSIEASKQCKFGSHLVEAMAQLLSSCYGQNVREIGIHGDPTGFLLRTLLARHSIPVIAIDDTATVVDDSMSGPSPYKLQLFTIVSNSTSQLQEILDKMKISPWWNHMASFLILNWRPESEVNNCSNAFEYLWAAWQMNILDANFMCVNEMEEVLLYTFNPYTAKAPDSWKLKNTFSGKNYHPWTMFVQTFEADEDCEEINFDKTEDLGGYKIPVSVQEGDRVWETNLNEAGQNIIGGIDGTLWFLIFKTMKANFELRTYSIHEIYMEINEEREIVGVVRDIIDKTSDIVANGFYLELYKNITTTYPFGKGGVAILTYRSGYLSQLEKINRVLDVSSRYGLFLVITGQLASLLTKEVEKKNVDTMEDLIRFGNVIHGQSVFAPYFKDPIFEGRFVGHNYDDCHEYVLRDHSVACIEDWNYLTSFEINPELHLSTNPIISTNMVYAIRDDWQLEKRLNKILGRMVAADIVRRAYTMFNEKLLNIRKFNEAIKRDEGPKVLTMTELNFAFAILGSGLLLASIVFIIELIVDYALRR